MATLLLDTSVLIDTINGKRNRGELLKELLHQGHLLACCPINVTEVCAGLRTHEESRTLNLLQSLQYYPITWPAWPANRSVTTAARASPWPPRMQPLPPWRFTMS